MQPIKELTQYFLQEEAAGIAHSGGSYLAHAIGVYRDLKSWDWDEEAARAGLFHSIYGTEIFQDFTLPVSRRNEIKSMIGEQAETGGPATRHSGQEGTLGSIQGLQNVADDGFQGRRRFRQVVAACLQHRRQVLGGADGVREPGLF